MILFSAVDNGSCLQGGCIYGEGGHLTGFCQPFVSQRGHSFCGCGQFFQLVGERADILCLYEQGIVLQIYDTGQGCVGDAVAHEQAVSAFLQYPAGCLCAVGSQGVERNLHGQILCLTGGKELRLGETGQPAVFLFHLILRAGNVNLYDFFAAVAAAGVGDIYGNRYGVGCGQGDFLYSEGEVRVGQAETERITHRHLEGVEVAITHIDAFFVFLGIHVAVVVRESPGIRVILVFAGPGIGQFAAGSHVAGKERGNGVSGLHTGLGDQYHAGNILIGVKEGKINDTTGVDQQDYVLVHAADGL